MASAAQPRSGTAPNAPAAITPPACWRNLRRLCRFGRIGWGPRSLWWFRTDGWRGFFMPFPPVAGQARVSRRRLTRFVVDGTVAPFKIVYNIVFNIIIVIED